VSYRIEMEVHSMADTAIAEDVAASANGSVDAYKRLVDRSRNLVCSIALAAVRDVAESEEIAQEVYLAAWNGLRGLRNPNSFLPWLRQLTRNECVDHLKRRGRARLIRGEEAEALLAAAVDGAPSAEQTVAQREQLRALSKALDELPDDSRETVVLFYREGHSVEQVASLLGLTPESVKQRLSRARARLHQSVLEHIGEAAAESAPGAAFSLAVVSALGLGVPGSATAATTAFASSFWTGASAAKLVVVVGTPALLIAVALGTSWLGPGAASSLPKKSEVAAGPSLMNPRAGAHPTEAGGTTNAEVGIKNDPQREPQGGGRVLADEIRLPSFGPCTHPAAGDGPIAPAAPNTRDLTEAVKDTMQAAVRAVMPQVKACYETALDKDPSLSGKVTLQLSLEANDGGARVTEGEVIDSETRSPFFEACVLEKVAGAKFQMPPGEGKMTMRYPIYFDPGGGFGGPAED
jgi:RNA polymerase sigma factor (sigma-70 family)